MLRQATLNPFYRGDSIVYKLRFQLPNRKPVDITNQSFWFTIKSKKIDPDNVALLQKSFFVADGVSGVVVLTIEAEETNTIAPGIYLYDIQKVNHNITPEKITTIASGSVQVLDDITRNTI